MRAVVLVLIAASFTTGCAATGEILGEIAAGVAEGVAEGMEEAAERSAPVYSASCAELDRRHSELTRWINDLATLANATGQRVRPEVMAEAMVDRDAIASEMDRRCG